MATYTPNEQLKGVVNSQFSLTNQSAHETYIPFSGLSVPSNEYWKIRIENIATKKDNNEVGTVYFRISNGPATNKEVAFDQIGSSKVLSFVPIGDYLSEAFFNEPEYFLHPGQSIGIYFTGDDIILDAYIDLTIFKYAIF